MRKNIDTFRLVYVSILVALAVALHTVETVLPVPYVLPGAKLGLANIVGLHAIYAYGTGTALLVTGVRALLGSLITGTFLGMGFALSLSGGILSTAVMGLMVSSSTGRQRPGPVGVSVAGAVTHNMTQLAVAAIITRQPGLVFYLPVLLLFAVPTGFFVGVVSYRMKPLEGIIRALVNSRRPNHGR